MDTKEAEDSLFLHADMKLLENERKKLARLYIFLERYISKTVSQAKNSYITLALFSQEGVLLDLFAKEEYLLNDLHKDGIRASGIWQESGYNAVTEGLEKKKSLSSVGEENEAEPLKKYAIYFSPISMLSIYEPYEPAEQCGLAIIVPLKYAWDEYLTMIVGIAHDMMITLQFNNIATMYYERSGKGLLSIDDMMSRTGSNLATYYNDELFRILGVKPIDMYYKPVECLIDPLPNNKELWSILSEHRTVSNYPITIRVHGRDVQCIASTDAFNQPSIKAHGVTFYLTTQQKMTAELSEKMANGAIKTFDDIIGEDEGLKGIIQRAKQMSATNSNIMILGESGTGKDVFAQAIHNASNRRGKPFIALNCGAMPRDLIESELFGYESGAFTGARKNGNMGKFELAMGGTVFLDEIGEMPLDLQAELLRVVEQKQLMRLGGSKMIDVDVKIIAATNADIWEMIEQKRFRADLFYRLSTMRLNLMPLRERKGDIIPLAEYFIRRISQKTGKNKIMRLSPKAKELLKELPWYGNVRELQNLIECIVQLYPGDMIQPQYIMENIAGYQNERVHETTQRENWQGREASSFSTVKPVALTREDILKALESCGNNRSEAAKYLGIARRTLYRKMDQFGIFD